MKAQRMKARGRNQERPRGPGSSPGRLIRALDALLAHLARQDENQRFLRR